MKKSIFLVIFLLSLTTLLPAQGVYFEHIGVLDGLSHYTVNCFYQDEHGFVWIGTRDGLNLYDGNEIRVYKQTPGDSSGLFGNNIRMLCGDRKGHVYMQCKSGVLSFDLRTEKATIIRRNKVSTICYGSDNLWFSLNDTIFSYNENTAPAPVKYLLLSNKTDHATALLESKDKLLFIATSNSGLQVYDRNRKVVKNFNINNIINLYEDSKKNIWACTRYDGLYRIDYTGNVVSYRNIPNQPNSLPDNFVRTICEDDLGNYWIGMYTGLCKLNLEKSVFSHYTYEREQTHGLSNSSIWQIMKDRQGTMWIGTYFGGVDLINPRYSIFNYYDAEGKNSNSLSSPFVGRIIEDQNNNLWIATDGGGINFFDRKTQTFQSYTSSPFKNSISTNNIKAMWLDEKRGNLWIGTHRGGLNKLNLKTKRFTAFTHNPNDPKSIPNDNIREIICRNDTLYLATQNFIGVFDLKSETCSRLKVNDPLNVNNREITDCLIDRQNRMWLAFSSTVYCIDMRTRKLKEYKSNNNVTVFLQDRKNRIWAGTDGDGIRLFNEKKNCFEPCVKFNNQLSSNYIVDMRQSSGGYYYVSTNDGLLIIDNEHDNSVLLNSKNGFPLDALNEKSIHINSQNEIFVGGINGMVSFQEKDLNMPREDYEINITGLRVNNKLMTPGEKSVIRESLPYLNEIVLKPEHSVFTILFGTTNYIKVLKTDVEYQLVGFDKNWIDANYRQSITYTNLNPGHYTLRIRGKNMTDSGIQPEKTIEIIVLPPFYKTTLAYLIYFILFALLSVYFFRFYTSRIQLRTSLEYEKRERMQIEEANQSKLRFFTNISHEFRTPLTLIINQLETTLQMGNVPQSIYGRLLNVMRNANRMKKLISELLDFRKYEQGYLQLKLSENNLIPFLNEIFLSFKDLAQSKGIDYTFIYKEPETLVWFDKNQLEKVFYNLLANAFKYTPNNGKITLSVEVVDYTVIVYVKENGVGIDKASLEKIFDRFYQAENSSIDMNSSQGSGIGLALAKGIVELHHGEIGVESQLKVGSKFWVKLRLGDSHFTDEERVSHQDNDDLCLTDAALPDEAFFSEIIDSQKAVNAEFSTILIIEDNEELLQMLVEIFRPIYKVITAVDGVDGFEKAVQKHPDIILSDVMMPRMTGIEMCGKLKSNLVTSHIPIVLLTARTAVDFIVQGLLTGADDYVIKPFNSKVLITRCNNLVNTRKILQKKFEMQLDSEHQLVATNSIDQQLLEKATRIIEANIDNPDFDISHFASEMYLSRTNLFHKLKGVTGQTPNDFIVNFRLKRSVHFLINSPELAIADIAVKLGFGSTSYFIKRFHKLFGVTPVQYRKNHANGQNRNKLTDESES